MMTIEEYLEKSVTPFQAIEASKEMLKEAGFLELDYKANWGELKTDKFFVTIADKTLVAFNIKEGAKNTKDITALKIAGAHTDYPCLHLKPAPEFDGKYCNKINTEVYGGPILNTWLDSPLSIAGKVALKGKDAFSHETGFVDFKRPVALIPNLPIHLNREVNNGYKLNTQIDLMPVCGLYSEGETDFVVNAVAKELGVQKEDILDFDLFLYSTQKPVRVGMNEEFLMSPRLDNISSCYPILKGIIEAGNTNSGKNEIDVAVLFDNEEVGSRSMRGADSTMLTYLLSKVYASLGQTREKMETDILNGFLLSIDAAHALHPNHPEKFDPTTQAKINNGIVVKTSGNCRYTFDCEATATVYELCRAAGIKYQQFANRSDEPGGTTLGPIISSIVPMNTVDIGLPMWAMHSKVETVGYNDACDMEKLVTVFYAD